MGLDKKYSNKPFQKYAGLGMAPKGEFEHQFLLHQFLFALKTQAGWRHSDLELMCETQLDPNDTGSRVPDVIAFRKHSNLRQYKPVFFIEVTTTRKWKAMLRKALSAAADYDVAEAFVYDYEKKRWARISGGVVNEDVSYSATFRLDLAELVCNGL